MKKCEICGNADADPEYPLRKVGQEACRECGCIHIKALLSHMRKWKIAGADRLFDENFNWIGPDKN